LTTASRFTTLSYIKRAAREKMFREWQHAWEARNKGKHYSGRFKKKPDSFFFSNNRKLVSAITQLRTGHGHFNSYLHGIPSADVVSSLCSCSAGEHQTPRHLILSCHHNREARKALNESFGKRRSSVCNRCGMERLVRKFLLETGIANRERRLRHLRRDSDRQGAGCARDLWDWGDVGQDQEEDGVVAEEGTEEE
jgi:hypothetical protein